MQLCSISVSATLYNQIKSSYYNPIILLQSTKARHLSQLIFTCRLSAIVKQGQCAINQWKENDTCSIPSGLFAAQYVKLQQDTWLIFESENMDIITSRVEWCEFRCTNKWLTLDLHSYSSQSMAGWLLCGSHTSLARCRPPKFACDWPAGERRERDLHLHSTHVTLLCAATLQGLTSNAPPSLKVKGFNSSQEFKMKRNCLGGSKELSYFWDSNKKKNSVALCDRRKKK